MLTQSPINFLDKPSGHNPPPQSSGKALFFVSLILLLFVGGCLTRLLIGEYAPQDPLAYDPVTLEAKKPDGLFNKITHLVFTKEHKLLGYKDDRINLLLLGIGGPGHDGPYLTDTMIIASVKPSTGQVAMISIPRDLGVKIPGHGTKKINHANAYGESEETGSGPELAKQVIEDTFDLEIHYYLRVDFKAFVDIVNEVGGLNVDVDRSFVDHLYPAPDYEYQTVSFNAGPQSMTGEKALQFVRSRHGTNGEASDFSRAKRQQKILFALKEKLLTFSTLANPVRINNIRNTLSQHLVTDLQFADIVSFLRLFREMEGKQIITLVLDNGQNGFLNSSTAADGAFILVPRAGNFKDINTTIENIFEEQTPAIDNTPAQTAPLIEPANIEIQNGTWVAGTAARLRKQLQEKNFIVTTIGNTEDKPILNSGIYQIKESAPLSLLQALQQELHIAIKQNLPPNIVATSTTDILVIIGEDLLQ
ncbi:MAG TPA: LCP family protein [Patescibacteria group bacterium]|nr:LCP family protein [Patescibacteria group bacterium]